MAKSKDMLNYQAFTRELQNSGLDKRIIYMFGVIYERMVELAEHVDTNAEITLALASSMERFVELHEVTQKRIQELTRRGETPGVTVTSEPWEKN